MSDITETNLQSAARCKLLLESLDGIIWEADPNSLALTYISEKVFDILGYTPEECLSDKTFWMEHLYKDDRDYVASYYQSREELSNHTITYRAINSTGEIVWMRNNITIVIKDGEIKMLCGLIIDITDSQTLIQLEKLEKHIFELNAEPNADIDSLLSYYVTGIENIFPNTKCSILRIANGKAFNWASPSLPEKYVTYIDGMSIGPNKGSCGTAAHLATKIIVADIETDEKWADFKDIALPNGLRACWSEPIMNSNGEVIATFAIYYNHVKSPNFKELAIINRAATLLHVIIENHTYASTIEEINIMSLQGQELANFGIWQWDMKNNRIVWSDTLYDIYGLKRATYTPSYESYLSKIHPEDLDRVRTLLENAHKTNTGVTFEERIVRPDGSIRELRSWFRVVKDNRDEPVKYLGASIDITLTKDSERRMEEIARQQSHEVRAPLARIMGITDLIKNASWENMNERNMMLDALVKEANELDKVIRAIDYNTNSQL